MNKKINIIVILISSFIIIGTIIYKLNLNLDNDIYVVSDNEDNKEIEKNYEIDDNIESKNEGNEILKNVTIYISGEVNKPGIVTIENDKRLYDAIEKLGGVTENADLNKINLAVKLDDEEHYIIPKIGDENIINNDININDYINKNNINNNDNESNSKININTANIEELDNLPGVGEATANKILSYREENGMFKSIDEIKNVNGIGDKKYIDLKDKICIEWFIEKE